MRACLFGFEALAVAEWTVVLWLDQQFASSWCLWKLWPHRRCDAPVACYAAATPLNPIHRLQMVTNLLWGVLFYRLHRINWALACCSLNQTLLWATSLMFHWTAGPTAARLFLPCIAYSAFQWGWNHYVWRRNRPGYNTMRIKLAEATALNMGPPSGNWPGSAGSGDVGSGDIGELNTE